MKFPENLKQKLKEVDDEIAALLKQRDIELRKLQGKRAALQFLIDEENNPDAVGEFIPAQSMTDQIKTIFREHPRAVYGTGDIIKQLRAWGRMESSRDYAIVGTTLNRLQKSNPPFLKDASTKEGRAWSLAEK